MAEHNTKHSDLGILGIYNVAIYEDFLFSCCDFFLSLSPAQKLFLVSINPIVQRYRNPINISIFEMSRALADHSDTGPSKVESIANAEEIANTLVIAAIIVPTFCLVVGLSIPISVNSINVPTITVALTCKISESSNTTIETSTGLTI